MIRNKEQWNINELPYPPEPLIRIFLGNFPNLRFLPKVNSTILDLGCGSGRNFPFFKELGLRAYGVETDRVEIEETKKILSSYKIPCELKTGTNQRIPYDDSFFQIVISWNSFYYMTNGDVEDTRLSINEIARVMKDNSDLIISIPKHSSFIFKDSIKFDSTSHIDGKYIIVKNDPWKLRNGVIMRIYYSVEEIVDEFSSQFDFMSNAEISDDFFGYNYHWYILHFKKRTINVTKR